MNDNNVLEEIILPRGMEPDVNEGWGKIISRQFGGSAGRGFCELVQNSIDSHSNGTPMEDRYAVIRTAENYISITDWGEGMSLKRLKFLVTLGGTDKHDDPDKLGQFGLGFFSIFNPGLGTKEVRVTTKSEGRSVAIIFKVHKAEHIPEIMFRVLDEDLNFSTKVEVFFHNHHDAVKKCVDYAEEYLRYYPCRIMVNNTKEFNNVWKEAEKEGAYIFKEKYCHGFIKNGRSGANILCKYEKIISLSMSGFMNGGRDASYDLGDYKEFPYLPQTQITINYDKLDLTISRDSFYLNGRHREMVNIVRTHMLRLLEQKLGNDSVQDNQLILANQYIFRKSLREYLRDGRNAGEGKSSLASLVRTLAKRKVYHVKGFNDPFSLQDMVIMKSADIPLFFSVKRKNLSWLGGSFKHDFIVLPEYCDTGRGAFAFYETLFGEIFGCAVNLDTITEDKKMIHQLVTKGIVDRKAVNPSTKIIGNRDLTIEESAFLNEIRKILMENDIKVAIERNLFLRYDEIKAMFFDVDEEGVTIATGMFDSQSNPIEGTGEVSDCDYGYSRSQRVESYATVKLGIRLNHPLVRKLIASQDPVRAYYAVTFLAGQLAYSQDRLTPATPFFNKVKEKLAADMRRVLIHNLYGNLVS